MILSAQTIRAIRPVEPFIEATKIAGMTAGLSHCGYDIRIRQNILLPPGDFSLASTIEHFDMPNDVMAQVFNKSTWARLGLHVWATILEPKWSGHLTLELANHSHKALQIMGGSPIAQVIFHRLDASVAGYAGKYQSQPDRPVPAILERSE